MTAATRDTRTLRTIGHSTHPLERFVELLGMHAIDAVADVRSTPYSRHNPQYNRESLTRGLAAAGVRYLDLGSELGAKSPDPSHYVQGRVQYGLLAASNAFRSGLERVRTALQSHRLALMCAEREPLRCHRTILVCRHLRAPGLSIQHILANGSLEPHALTERRLVAMARVDQGDLFQAGDVVDRAYDAYGARIAHIKVGAS